MVSDGVYIDICICTFRRSHVAETLRSISQLLVNPEWSVSVLVVDNDDTPSARDIVENAARDCAFPVRYLYAPGRNISVARNACLDAATAPLVAFIDDDELASPQWLTALVATLESGQRARAVEHLASRGLVERTCDLFDFAGLKNGSRRARHGSAGQGVEASNPCYPPARIHRLVGCAPESQVRN